MKTFLLLLPLHVLTCLVPVVMVVVKRRKRMDRALYNVLACFLACAAHEAHGATSMMNL